MKPALCAALALAALPLPAFGNGNNAHVWISRGAVAELPDGELRRLLVENEDALLNGTLFPDGGYVIDDDYGEMAHWEPFVDAYVRFIRERFRPPFRGEAARHVAFLMGAASHGMADQTFDAMFMKAGRVYDAANWSDELLESFDSLTDVMLAADTSQVIALEPWYPLEMPELYRDKLDYTVDAGKLENAQYLLVNVVLDFGASQAKQPDKVAAARARYPWAAAHLLDGVTACGPPCEAHIVAAYLRALWDRLHDELRPENLVVATVPRDGAAGHPTDHTRVESQVVIAFGHGIDDATLPASSVRVADSQGRPYAVTRDFWGGKHTNVVRLVPEADWPADEELTATIAPGLRTIDGLTLEAPWSFRFSTRAAAEPGRWGDPTPREGEPASAAASGCALTPGARGATIAAPLLLLLSALLLRRLR